MPTGPRLNHAHRHHEPMLTNTMGTNPDRDVSQGGDADTAHQLQLTAAFTSRQTVTCWPQSPGSEVFPPVGPPSWLAARASTDGPCRWCTVCTAGSRGAAASASALVAETRPEQAPARCEPTVPACSFVAAHWTTPKVGVSSQKPSRTRTNATSERASTCEIPFAWHRLGEERGPCARLRAFEFTSSAFGAPFDPHHSGHSGGDGPCGWAWI